MQNTLQGQDCKHQSKSDTLLLRRLQIARLKYCSGRDFKLKHITRVVRKLPSAYIDLVITAVVKIRSNQVRYHANVPVLR